MREKVKYKGPPYITFQTKGFDCTNYFSINWLKALSHPMLRKSHLMKRKMGLVRRKK